LIKEFIQNAETAWRGEPVIKHVKKIIFVAAIVFAPLFFLRGPVAAPSTHFTFNPPQPWKTIQMDGVAASWTIPGEVSRPALIVTEDVGDDFLDPKNMDEAAIIPQIEQARAVPYQLFGITDWKIEKHSVSKYADGLVMQLEGHYHSPGGNQVHFVERDYLLGFNSYKVVFSEEVTGATSHTAKTIEQIQKWLSGFEPDGKKHS
jgi:hypothetical protein